MAALDFSRGLQLGQAFKSGRVQNRLDDLAQGKERQTALFQDVRNVRTRLQGGDVDGANRVIEERIRLIQQFGGDPSDTLEIRNRLASGDTQGAITLLETVEGVGVGAGLLSDPLDRQIKEAKLAQLTPGADGPVRVQSSKILDDGTVINVLRGGSRQVISSIGEVLTGNAARLAVEKSRDQKFNRDKELARLAQTIKREERKEGLFSEQQLDIQRGNIKRLGTLSGTSSGRASSIKKATKFKLALERGEALSGAGRKGASFIPGVFTSQGQFDEEFNAFSEVAARQQLKASGETRPTDADVQGMKQAMFGIGRDEAVNVQLLSDFINDQNAQDNELDQLIEASRGGTLSEFTFTPRQIAQPDTATLSDEDLFK